MAVWESVLRLKVQRKDVIKLIKILNFCIYKFAFCPFYY